MSMRHGLLALLEDGPNHGYQLKHEFEARTGGAWLLNVGQVYTTLQRLERDGLVAPVGDPDDERRVYTITAAGQEALEHWFGEPVVVSAPPRDELAIKVLLAVAAEEVDVTSVLQRQRTATLEQLQEYTRLKRQADPDDDLPWILLLDALVLKAEAEVRWLDTCEARLRRRDGAKDHGGSSDAPTRDPARATDGGGR